MGFYYLIMQPTQYCPSNISDPSLLDHIWINSYSYDNSGLFSIDITNNVPIFFLFFSNSIDEKSEKVTIRFPDKNSKNKLKFIKTVSEFQWNSFKTQTLDIL